MLQWSGRALLAAGPVARRAATSSPLSKIEETGAPSEPLPHLVPGNRRLLLVMIDGLPTGLFSRELAAGRLPRLEALFAERPTLRTTALSTFPSATSPSVPELLSGRYASLDNTEPGAVHAFDRERRRVVRYLTEPDAWHWPVANLFDAARAAGLPTATVFEGRWDGPQTILTRGAITRAAALEAVGIGDRDGDRGPVEKLLRLLRSSEPPRVTLLVFDAVDLAGHFHGPDSPEARDALARTDALLGDVLDTLRALPDGDGGNLLAHTDVMLFGDHGMVPSGHDLDLQPFFEQRGLDTFDASTLTQVVLRERFGKLWTQWPDVLLVSGGSNVTQVYFRAPNGAWADDDPPSGHEASRTAPRPDVAALAVELTAVEGVAQTLRPVAPGRVEVRSGGGLVAEVVQREVEGELRFAYLVPWGALDDPLGYLRDPQVARLVCRDGGDPDPECFHDRDRWIRTTFHCRYPGVVPLLGKAFDPPRFAGDLMVTALPGWTFLRGQKGDHGNLEREAMLTPLVLNGPDIDPSAAPPEVRLVDIYPTAAVLLGADPADPALQGLDGRPLPVRPGQIAHP